MAVIGRWTNRQMRIHSVHWFGSEGDGSSTFWVPVTQWPWPVQRLSPKSSLLGALVGCGWNDVHGRRWVTHTGFEAMPE